MSPELAAAALAYEQAFWMINACTVDFRWTYRLPLAQLERASR